MEVSLKLEVLEILLILCHPAIHLLHFALIRLTDEFIKPVVPTSLTAVLLCMWVSTWVHHRGTPLLLVVLQKLLLLPQLLRRHIWRYFLLPELIQVLRPLSGRGGARLVDLSALGRGCSSTMRVLRRLVMKRLTAIVPHFKVLLL